MSEWDRRELCPDGGCVGVIGSDGTCKTCGKRGVGATSEVTTAADSGGAKRGEATDFDEDDEYYYEDDESDDDDESDGDDDDDDEGDADADEDGVASVSAEGSAAPAVGGEWGKRQLCPDGACVGVIGDNGRCRVCGKSGGPG